MKHKKHEKFDMNFREEGTNLLLFLIVSFIILKIVFYKSSFAEVLRLLAGFLFFVIPGILLVYIIVKESKFLERVFLGALLGFAMMGILSYYIGIFLGIHAKYYTPWLAVAISAIEIVILLFLKK